MLLSPFILYFFTFFVTGLAAGVNNAANQVCSDIRNKVGAARVAFNPHGPFGYQNGAVSALYQNTTSTYWDAANTADRPACILFPNCAQDVSIAVKSLRQYPSVPFALKSGGHQFNRGFSSTDGGVLISFRPHLTSIRLSDSTACVGPGARWQEVANKLDSYHKVAVGARQGDVGVGGSTVMGGMSFMSTEYGFISDNVVNFQAVLANGTVVTASQYSNPDLFYALRGGGNAFAIVTEICLKVYDIDQVWGGWIVYNGTAYSKFNAAVSRFITYNKDPKAAVTPVYTFRGPGPLVNVLEAFLWYNGPKPPRDIFADFTAIPSLYDNTRTQSHGEILNVPNTTSALGIRTAAAMISVPNIAPTNMTAFLDWHWHQASNAAVLRSAEEGNIAIFNIALQPVPVDLQRVSAATGASPLHMNPANGDRMWIEYDIGWNTPSCDAYCPKALKAVAEAAKRHYIAAYGGLQPTNYKSGDLKTVGYKPLFMNDAQDTQNVLASYGASNYQRLKAIHKVLDPTRFFTRRQNGFKFES